MCIRDSPRANPLNADNVEGPSHKVTREQETRTHWDTTDAPHAYPKDIQWHENTKDPTKPRTWEARTRPPTPRHTIPRHRIQTSSHDSRPTSNGSTYMTTSTCTTTARLLTNTSQN
eukprot:10651437-Prorocentrum_lima.AAC.1